MKVVIHYSIKNGLYSKANAAIVKRFRRTGFQIIPFAFPVVQQHRDLSLNYHCENKI